MPKRDNTIQVVRHMALIAGVVVATTLFWESTKIHQVKVLPPDLQVVFHQDGRVEVYNPGTAPEMDVSLCSFIRGDILIATNTARVRIGQTQMLGPGCSICTEHLVVGPRCLPDSIVVARK